MKPTEEQLNDPQWWDDFQPKGCELLLVCENPEGGYLWAHFNGTRYEVGAGSYSSGFVLDNYTLHRKPERQGNNEKHDAVVVESKFIPEAGECEYRVATQDETSEWMPCWYIGLSKHGRHVYELGGVLCRSDATEFRPIKSEREKFIEWTIKVCGGDYVHVRTMAGIQYDNGARVNDE